MHALAKKIGPGQEYRDGTGGCERPHAVFRSTFEMIGGERPEAGGECGGAGLHDLVGMYFERKPERRRHLEHARRFLRRERDRVAEDIDRVGKFFCRDARQHDVANQFEISRAPPGVFRRHDVSSQIRRTDRYPDRLFQASRDREHAQLRRDVEAVPRFNFDGRRPARDQRAQAAFGASEQARLVRRARHGYGMRDAALAVRSRNVSVTGRTAFEIRHPLTAEDEMRVRLDEAGRHPTAAHVDDATRERLGPLRQLGHGTEPRDFSFARRERSVA